MAATEESPAAGSASNSTDLNNTGFPLCFLKFHLSCALKEPKNSKWLSRADAFKPIFGSI